MFEQTFKNIDDILFKDAGADSELDYIGQTSWVMFLRYLDELEQDKADEAGLQGKEYKYIIDEEYRWPNWAMPKTDNGKLDIHKAMTGVDLVQFVDHKLFPYLAGFKLKTDNPQTIEYKIGEIFSELKNKIQSGYNLREIIEMADTLPFRSSKDKHELSHLYETKIKNMGNAGRNGGQYYTPRPLIRAMIQVIQPKIGEKIYDGACGSGGFLCEAFEYLSKDKQALSTTDLQTLQLNTFYGKEKKNLAYVIGIMNMILHGIEAPNIIHTNTLGENIRDIQEKDRHHVILANPPFGGKERPEVQQNFDIKTGETASLFLQHFIKSLKTGGRAAIVIKNTFLSNSDNASISLRKHLLESCNLHTILDMPGGTFTGAGVKTVVLFFTKGEPTKNIWYYQLDTGRNMGKTNPLNDRDMSDFLLFQKDKKETINSWNVNIETINQSTFDISVNNPNVSNTVLIRSPKTIIEEISDLVQQENDILQNIEEYQTELNKIFNDKGAGWTETKLGDVCKFVRGPFGGSLKKEIFKPEGIAVYEQQHAIYDQFEDIRYFIDEEKFNEMKRFELLSGDLIMSCSGTMGKVAIVPVGIKKGIINQALLKLTPNSKLEVKYLKYWMESEDFQISIAKHSQGAAIKNVASVSILKTILLPCPSIEIQKIIIKQLDELNIETSKLEEVYTQKQICLKELNKSFLHVSFSNENAQIELA
jgi:type I restriction enzyme M protein